MDKYCVINRLDEKSAEIKEYIKAKLALKFEYDEENPTYCFAVGGDGTLLFAIHKYLDKLDDIKFIGIHTGTLGFFSDYNFQDVDECLEAFLNEKPKVSSHPMLEARLSSGECFYAVNEIRVEDIIRAQMLDIKINDEEFEKFRGNGILVCTQLGSTAYNRSLGGSIIDNGVECIEMTEIAGLSHANYRSIRSSIIFKDSTKITLYNEHFKGVSLLYDQFQHTLENEEYIEIKQSNKKVRILRYRNIPYLQRIKDLV